MPELSLEQKAGENFFGDLILYETNSILATGMGWFTGSVYNHCAIRTSEHRAEAPDLVEWYDKRDFIRHNLREPEKYVISYKILRHKDMTNEKRAKMMDFYQKVGREYDLPKIVRLAKRILWRREQDLTDLTTDPEKDLVYQFSKMIIDRFGGRKKGLEIMNPIAENSFKMHECASIYSFLVNLAKLDYGIEGVHYSQIMPHQLENKKHDVIDVIKLEGRRHRIWARNNVVGKFSRIRSVSSNAGIKTLKGISSLLKHKP
ncbi:MAG: hypothetical protein AABX93_03695 [Nanoarchaeota archaeon]|mgnify:CR=1 FL=1